MANFNKVIMAGNLTRDVDVKNGKTNGNSWTIADCGVAVNRRISKDKDEVMFIDITAFGKTAEYLGQYCKKGTPVLIEGRLSFTQWEKDGQKYSKHSVVVEKVNNLSKKADDKENGNDNEEVPF